jgi:hypothetical protein
MTRLYGEELKGLFGLGQNQISSLSSDTELKDMLTTSKFYCRLRQDVMQQLAIWL